MDGTNIYYYTIGSLKSDANLQVEDKFRRILARTQSKLNALIYFNQITILKPPKNT